MTTSARRRFGAVLALACLLLAACTSGGGKSYPALPSPSGSPPPRGPAHPNIVFVLTDDLSWNLVNYMPHVRALEQRGMTFTNYTVTDSLCCPSRASIFTGRFPHDTHIYENTLPRGGFIVFRNRQEDRNTFATSLLQHGYLTGFMGKYLNGYQPRTSSPRAVRKRDGAWVARGWTTWDSAGAAGYREFNYAMAEGHKVVNYQHRPQQYMTTVLGHKAEAFIKDSAGKPNPFLLEVATFAPHTPYVPAPIDRGTFAGIAAPRTPAYGRAPSPAPAWMRNRPPLTAIEQRNIQHWWQLRVESVQSVDRMVGDLERTLQRTGQAKNTVFVFSSDNGYHLGEYTLEYGKQTAFDTDIRVPLIVAGPGIPAGSINAAMAQNIDLRPTFEQLAGAPTPAEVDGHSLVPLLHGENVPWRRYALIEHHHPDKTPTDPDLQNHYAGNPPTYTALRGADFLYVRYVTGDREYYDLTKDPYELHNLGPTLPKATVARLDTIMNALVNCHDGAACWAAGVPTAG